MNLYIPVNCINLISAIPKFSLMLKKKLGPLLLYCSFLISVLGEEPNTLPGSIANTLWPSIVSG